MNTPSHSSPSRRLFNVLAAAIALPLIALVPAFLASSWITHEAIDQIEPTQLAVTLNDTVIDTDPSTPESIDPQRRILDSDLIHITISGTDSALHSGQDGDCTFTLHIDDDDLLDDEPETFTGHLRVSADDLGVCTMYFDDIDEIEIVPNGS